jgi:ribonuclease J
VGLQRRMRRELQVEPLIICLVQAAPAGTPAVRSRQERHHDRGNSSNGNGNGNGSNGNVNGAASDDSRQRRRRPSATVG